MRFRRVRIAETLPAPEEHRARIRAALRYLNDRESGLQKVVLARALRLVADGRLDERAILRRLVDDDAEATAYLADLSPAGDGYAGAVLVGASPELLVARSGDQVTCQPFAGSAARSADPQIDAANGAALAESGKNRHEHQLVVDTMRAALEPLCTDLDVAPDPQLSRTAALWHLSTPIRGTLREKTHHCNRFGAGTAPDPGRRRCADRGRGGPDRRTGGRSRLLRRRGGLVRRPR